MDQNLLTFYEEYKNKLAAFSFAISGIHFDQATIAPKAGAPYAIQMQSILEGESFSFKTDPENIKKIETLFEETTDPLLKKELTLRLRDLRQISSLPKEVFVDFRRAVAEGQRCWEQAKLANNYEMFKPHLISLIEKRKKTLTYLDFEGSDYDYLLDQYQIGMNIEKYDAFFQEIKDKLVPLIHQIKTKGRKIDKALLLEDFDIKQQKAFTEVLKQAFQVDDTKCLVAESLHPFCAFFSPNDVRFTTKYMTENVLGAVLSVMHEYGHALFGLQVDPAFAKSMLMDGIGFAMHESQSRLLENHIGRNTAFWKAQYPKLQELFPDQLRSVSLESFMNMMNATTPSLIRVEADELTYPLHILIRYELEKEIFNGTVDINVLDKLWADKYEEYLGIRPQTYSEGILQDIHWSAAYFGYFPSYALGSAFAAQFNHQLQKELSVDEILENGQFDKIADWVHENIHRHGASKTFDEILVDVTGEAFNPSYYTDYLVAKYKKLYHL